MNQRSFFTILILFFLLPSATFAQKTLIVEAGTDTTIRLGMDFRFSPSVRRDEKAVFPQNLLWSQIDGPQDGAEIMVPTALRSAVLFSTPGEYVFSLCVTDDGMTTCDTMTCTVLDSIPFVVHTPQGNDLVKIGSAFNLYWSVYPAGPVTIALSTDGGMTFDFLTQGQINDTFWVWQVDETLKPSQSCFIRIARYSDFTEHTISSMFSLIADDMAVGSPKGIFRTAKPSGSGRSLMLNGRQSRKEIGPGKSAGAYLEQREPRKANPVKLTR